MTAEELKRLAEIAGLPHCENLDGSELIARIGEDWIYWQPHIRIDQAMMVADVMKKYLDGHFMLWWFEDGMFEATFHGKPYKMPFVFKAESKSPAEAICRAALAAKED